MGTIKLCEMFLTGHLKMSATRVVVNKWITQPLCSRLFSGSIHKYNNEFNGSSIREILSGYAHLLLKNFQRLWIIVFDRDRAGRYLISIV